MVRHIILAVVATAVLSTPLFAQNLQQEPPSISTQGEALFTLPPDVAWINITAEARAAKPGDAQRQAAEAMTAVQAAVKTLGLAANAIRTLQYSLQPDMEYVNGSSRVKGYIARHSVEVRVDDVSRLGTVIDAAGASGAASVSGMRFDVKNRNAVEKQALAAAAKDALARAKAIAEGLGQTVTSTWRVVDQRISSPSQFRSFEATAAPRGMAASAAPTPVEPGEVEIRAQMSVTVLIK